MTPVVSVVMPMLNTAAFLPEAVESILAQSFADLELIIADDGSSDDSREIAAGYARADSRVRTLALPRNPSGISGARAANAAIDVAQGEFIARMDSDDIAAPDRFAVQLAHMRGRGLDICGGQCWKMGAAEQPPAHPTSRDGIRNELLFRSASILAALTLRAPLMRALRFGEADAFEQYEFQTRAVFAGNWENVTQVVHHFRVHPNSATHLHHARKADSNWQLRFRYFFARFPDATLGEFQVIHRIARRIAIETAGDLETAGRWLLRLSRVEEAAARAHMRRRWDDACAIAQVDPGRIGELRNTFGARFDEAL